MIAVACGWRCMCAQPFIVTPRLLPMSPILPINEMDVFAAANTRAVWTSIATPRIMNADVFVK